MNIFILNNNPTIVFDLIDKHIVKMPLETAQILCTVAQLKGFTAPYRMTHKNHPVVKWAAQSSANWIWLCYHGIALCEEYTYRYGKEHKCQAIIQDLKNRTAEIWGEIKSSQERTKFALCMPDQYKVDDPVESYRNYYRGDKARIAKWTKRDQPEWWNK